MSILSFFKRFTETWASDDAPGAVIPSEVIRKFPLLYLLPDLIGFDLRKLTEDKLDPMDITLKEQLDGIDFAGNALIHQNYLVAVDKGEDVNGCPCWSVHIFMRNVNTEYMQDLSQRLYQVYGTPYASYGAGKWTGHDHEEAQRKKVARHKSWLNQRLEGWALKKCILSLSTYEYGRIAALHYHVYEE